MARIIIAPAGGGTELEVEQVTFDEGFFHGYVYVRDAPTTASSEPTAEETRVAGFVTGGTVLPAALRAALVLPKVGGYTYNGDGTVASGPDGETYAYNSDGTVHSVTLNGTTRTYSYNADGTVASAA